MITAKVTPEQYEELSSKFGAETGMELKADSGVISKDGVQAKYDYDGSTLRIEVTHKPMLMPLGVIENRIRDGLRQSGLEVA